MHTKEQLLTGRALKVITFELPELGGQVRMREPSASAAVRARELQRLGPNAETEMMAEMISSTMLDPSDSLMFTKDEATRLLDQISIATATALIQKFNELVVGPLKEGPGGGNSQPSQSAS